jgi:iron-sulfur cluster repair protein YtfE (RIC family)
MAHQNLAAQPLFEFLDQTHQDIQVQLVRLEAIARQLHETGELDSQARSRAQAVLDFFNTQARQHHLDEEKHVFPQLLDGDDAALVAAVRRLQQDHGWIEANWTLIAPLLEGAVHGNIGFEPVALEQAIEVFVPLCIDHLLLEESMVYPAAQAQLATWVQSAAGKEVAVRRQKNGSL